MEPLDSYAVNIKEVHDAIYESNNMSANLRNKCEYLIQCMEKFHQAQINGKKSLKTSKDSNWAARKKIFREILLTRGGTWQQFESMDTKMPRTQSKNNYKTQKRQSGKFKTRNEELNGIRNQMIERINNSKAAEIAMMGFFEQNNQAKEQPNETEPSKQKSMMPKPDLKADAQENNLKKLQAIPQDTRGKPSKENPKNNSKWAQMEGSRVYSLIKNRIEERMTVLEKGKETVKSLQRNIAKGQVAFEKNQKRIKETSLKGKMNLNPNRLYFVSIEVENFKPERIKSKIGLSLPVISVKKKEKREEINQSDKDKGSFLSRKTMENGLNNQNERNPRRRTKSEAEASLSEVKKLKKNHFEVSRSSTESKVPLGSEQRAERRPNDPLLREERQDQRTFCTFQGDSESKVEAYPIRNEVMKTKQLLKRENKFKSMGTIGGMMESKSLPNLKVGNGKEAILNERPLKKENHFGSSDSTKNLKMTPLNILAECQSIQSSSDFLVTFFFLVSISFLVVNRVFWI